MDRQAMTVGSAPPTPRAASQDESLLRSFIEQTPACIAMLDRDLRYLAASARYSDDFGVERDLIGKSHYDVFPESPEHWKQNNRRARAGETLRAEREAIMSRSRELRVFNEACK